jgi:hypothetical protein
MNRLEWSLGIILVILLIVVAVFSALLWLRPGNTPQSGPADSAAIIAARANQIAPTPVFAGQTAKVALAAAQSEATVWQGDATLLNANATWPQGASSQDLLTGETTWSFTFYSPQIEETALISVVENEATLLSTSPNKPTAPVLSATGWQLDSSDIIEQFLSEGGSDFILNNGVTTLTIMLSTNNETGRIEWFISLFGDQTLRSLIMRVDATSGEVLEGPLDENQG